MDHSNLREITEQEFVDYFSDLFWDAFKKGSFDVVCAVLRAGGMQDIGWDPFEESLEAFEEYNALLKSQSDPKTRWRLGLLMYCQAVEMTAPQEFLGNILRILDGKKYHMKPFGFIGRTKKNKPFSWVPPSATAKYRELKKLAGIVGQKQLCEYIDHIFDENVRNAFSHSDYVITPEHFRWTESGLPAQVSLGQLDILIHNCFRFFSVLLWLHQQVQKDLAKLPKYHKWPNYEVLELLTDSDGLYGFSLHFSNGNKATYSRRPEGTDSINLMFEADGSINFMVGLLDAQTNQWLIDGKPYEEVVKAMEASRS